MPVSYRALTVALLPPRIREAFEFPCGAAEQRAVQWLLARIRHVYPLLPERLRYVGPYQEAEQRLAGKARPDMVTRMCNRFWIGRAQLPSETVG